MIINLTTINGNGVNVFINKISLIQKSHRHKGKTEIIIGEDIVITVEETQHEIHDLIASELRL